jgi:hypothetical protein
MDSSSTAGAEKGLQLREVTTAGSWCSAGRIHDSRQASPAESHGYYGVSFQQIHQPSARRWPRPAWMSISLKTRSRFSLRWSCRMCGCAKYCVASSDLIAERTSEPGRQDKARPACERDKVEVKVAFNATLVSL